MKRLLWWSTTTSYDDECDENTCHAMTPNKNLMPHDAFLLRIRKTLYVGGHVSTTSPSVSAPSVNSQKISRPLADYAADLFSESHRGRSGTLNRLNSVTVSKLGATPCPLIMAMIYMDRLQVADPMYARRITPTELFLVSMLVSSKFYYGYDESVRIDDFLDAAGDDHLTLDTLKMLELDLLDALNWDVYVSNAEFFAKLCSVERELAQRQGCARGWLTYTELAQLAQLFPSLAIARAFLKYSTVFTVSYAASVFTIAGAFLVASQVPGTALYQSSAPMRPTVDNCSTTSAVLHSPASADNGDADSRTIGLEEDDDATETTTEQDRTFERLQDLYDTSASTPLNDSNSTTDDHQTPGLTNRIWSPTPEPSDFPYALHSVVNLRRFIASAAPSIATTNDTNPLHLIWGKPNDVDMAVDSNRTKLDDGVFPSDATCRRATGATLWMQFI